MKKFYRLGIAPYTPILSGLIFDNKRDANRRSKDENRCGEYRGRGVRVYPCNEDGQILVAVAPRECTCVGSCRGSEGLGDNWRCVLHAA